MIAGRLGNREKPIKKMSDPFCAQRQLQGEGDIFSLIKSRFRVITPIYYGIDNFFSEFSGTNVIIRVVS